MSKINWNAECSYNYENKKRFHNTARTRLRNLAKELGFETGSYDLRSNKGGIAVSGEITLHHENVYIQVSQSCFAHGDILIRTCKGRNDDTGGHNHFAALKCLDDIPALARHVERIAGFNPYRRLENYQVIIRAIHDRGQSQNHAIVELSRRGLWLTDEQKQQADLTSEYQPIKN
jgi:hypothetical protein